MRQCYDNFFKSWHEEYEYWADDEDAIREELHHNQYEDRLYYENGDVYKEGYKSYPISLNIKYLIIGEEIPES